MDELRRSNRFRVIETIRAAVTISRTDLATTTGLSGATITDISQELLCHNVITERKVTKGERGRPRVQLRLNDLAHVAGIFVTGRGEIDVQVASLSGIIKVRGSINTGPLFSATDIVSAIAHAIRTVTASAGLPMSRIIGSGISLGATVDSNAGIIHWLPPSPPESMEFAALLREELAHDVFIDNVANVIGRAERWQQSGGASDGNCYLIVVGPGLGLVRYWDGRVRSEGHGMNSEFGHIKVRGADDFPCSCGSRGCLATAASIGGMVTRWRQQQRADKQSCVSNLMITDFEGILAAAKQQDANAIALVKTAGYMLASAIGNLINMTNPDKIIIICQHAGWDEAVVPFFYERLKSEALSFLYGRVVIEVKSDIPDNHLDGAISMVQERIFNRETLPLWDL